jgi:hypothetical protein
MAVVVAEQWLHTDQLLAKLQRARDRGDDRPELETMIEIAYRLYMVFDRLMDGVGGERSDVREA